MKKYLLILIVLLLIALIIILSLTFYASKKDIDFSKDYIDEYYKNFSAGNSTQCFYQLNKNSSEILESKYNLGVEDLLSSRSIILGEVVDYEIQSEKYTKDGDNKVTDFDIVVNYKNATVNEKIQIIIKKDGQTSINYIEFEEDNVVLVFIDSYKNALITNDSNTALGLISEEYFESKSERNFKSMIENADTLGGKLLDCEIVSSNYFYDNLNIGSYVYEAILELKYENTTMQNKIRITEHNGELGIGYTIILPEKLLSFFEDYTSYLANENKEGALSLYNPELFEGDQDKMNSKWESLLTYSEAYGKIDGYEILSLGADTIELYDDSIIEVMKVEALINYSNKSVKHRLTLIEDTNEEYIIFEQYISAD